MFQIVAVPFDAFQSLPSAQHRWLLTCFSRYVDKAGKAFPSLRQLARDARMSLASVSRYMAAMERLGVFQRQRRPGRRYLYQLAEAYRPRWPGRPGRGVQRVRHGVPHGGTQQANLTKHIEKRFAQSGTIPSEIRDDRDQWEARLRSWQNSGGRFWLPLWGPKPTEPGCFVPPSLLQALSGRLSP